jgi:hypothetical protein
VTTADGGIAASFLAQDAKRECNPGGDELGAVEWSLGPQGAISETGRRHFRFFTEVQIESGLGRMRPTVSGQLLWTLW